MKSWAWAVAGLCIAVGVVGAPACGDDSANPTGTQGTGGNGGGATTQSTTTLSGNPTSTTTSTGTTQDCGDFAFNTALPPTCQPCAYDSCCDQVSACNQASDCYALLTCLGPCLDQACVDACNAQFPNGVDALDAFDACLTGSCAMDCGFSSCPDNVIGYNGDGSNPDLQPCDDCINNNCCDEYTALSAPCIAGDQAACDANIDALNACVGDPASPECTNNPVAVAAGECGTDNCSQLCPAPICTSGFTITPGTCAICLGNCNCQAFTDCGADQNCSDCLTGSNGGGVNCDQDPNFTAATACFEVTCVAECGG
jgi:hypothetical protein